MPPPVLHHDDVVAWVARARGRLALADAAAGFVASLSSAPVALRSALGSFAVARHFPEHRFVPTRRHAVRHLCGVCGFVELGARQEPFSSLALERTRQRDGGVGDAPTAIAYDLERFAAEPRPAPTGADRELLHALLDALRRLAGELPERLDGRDAAEHRVGTVLRATRTQRARLLDTLGFVGVLHGDGRAGHLDGFVPFDEREPADGRDAGRAWPFRTWTAHDGVDEAAVARAFAGVVSVAAV